MVGANIMSTSYAFTHLGEHPLEGIGIIHDVLLRRGDLEVALDFHVFDVYYFDILIGHPFEKVFLEAPTLGTLM
jgi:hypothetical protein